eukprot:TRINITY_DN9843_c0_g1_i2.p1 TRINITY_DN9843_c0_g1~~TRINITY_DN9843_c0_g1_i2.p1  ORF type:complete len:240 (-),score=62.99 TRINITY_DN9843_c0_g1_i2:333-1052(-)
MLPDQWVTDYTRCCAMTDTILADINNRNRLQQSGMNVSKQNAQIRKSIKELDEKIELLDDAVKLQLRNISSNLSEKESLRRQDKMMDLKLKRDELKVMHQKGPSENQSALFAPSRASQGRAWGNAAGKSIQETEETRELSSDELVQVQRQRMQEQDALIERIGMSVDRQKQIGLTIHDELTEQNKMLEDLEDQVDHTTSRLSREQQRINKILKKSSTKWLMCCLFISIVLFVLLVALGA